MFSDIFVLYYFLNLIFMKKILIFIAFFLSLIWVKYGYAHPGNTAADGCHYCRTNCDYRWVARNQRHCHNSWSSTSNYINTTPTYKSCTSTYWLFSKDNYNWTCSCIFWYHFETNYLWKTCVKDKTCYDLYWINSKDNYDWTCSCKSWYSFSKDYIGNDSCISNDNICQKEYWYSSKSDWKWYCICKDWYEWNSTQTSCVIKNNPIQTCWLNSYSTFSWECKCNFWYIWEDANDIKNFNCIKQKTYTELCQQQYWIHSYWDEKYCYCNNWYEFNTTKTSCIKVKEKTAIELCQESYWINTTSDGLKNTNWAYNCSCNIWYEWNSTQTSCVIKISSTTNISIIDKNKVAAEKIFQNIENKFGNYSSENKVAIYKKLIIKIDNLKVKSKGDILKTLNYLGDIINTEIKLEDINLDNLLQ